MDSEQEDIAHVDANYGEEKDARKLNGSNVKSEYHFNGKIDVVIIVALKDEDKLEKCVSGILKNSKTPINKVFIVAENLTILDSLSSANKNNEKIIGLSERIYPFSKHDIIEQLAKQGSHPDNASWYYQQLLKFYVFDVIPNICDNVLILDSDFTFIKPIEFLSSEGKGILSYGYPFQWLIGTTSYPNDNIKHIHINHAKLLVKNWDVMNPFTGMHHHMLINKHIMKSLFQNVEENHKETFWKTFINVLKSDEWTSASEYIIYFHFAIKFYLNKIELRHFNALDIVYDSEDITARGVASKLSDDYTQNKKLSLTAIGTHAIRNWEQKPSNWDSLPRGSSWLSTPGELLCSTQLAKKENFNIYQLNDKGALFVK